MESHYANVFKDILRILHLIQNVTGSRCNKAKKNPVHCNRQDTKRQSSRGFVGVAGKIRGDTAD